MEPLVFSLIPITALLLGAGVALLREPGPRLYSALQHFAAGVVFAGVAAELLPLMRVAGHTVEMAAGFLLGVAAMLGISRVTEGSGAFLAAIGVDLLVDGLLVGIGFAAGAREGKLLILALTLEVLPLGMSTSAALRKEGRAAGRILAIVAGLGLALVGGSVGGAALAGALTGGRQILLISFGAAALLYLVTEELLVEAHEAPDSALVTAQFFLGFLLVLVLDAA